MNLSVILEFEFDYSPLEKYKITSHYLIDINECLLNNGHGPCQDTCRNTIGGYECSCDSLQDTVLSADNHTCQTAGPCSVNNAGCSHTCLSTMGRVFCLCPDGFILEDDWKTCQGNRICLPFFLYLPMFFFFSAPPWKRNRGKFWITSGLFLSDERKRKRDFVGFSIIWNLVCCVIQWI